MGDDGATVRGGQGSIAVEMESLTAIPLRIDGVLAEIGDVRQRVIAALNEMYTITTVPAAYFRAGLEASNSVRIIAESSEEVEQLKRAASEAYENYRQAEQGNVQGFEAISPFLAVQDWVRRGRPSAFVVDRGINTLNLEKELVLLREAALDRDRKRVGDEVKRLKTLDYPTSVTEILDKLQDNIDDFIAPADISVSEVNRDVAPINFTGRVEDFIRPAQIIDDNQSEIAITEVTTPKGEPVYIVTIPGTQIGDGDENPFDMRGIFDAMLLNSNKMSEAVAQAMESIDPPPPEGSKVYLNGFSQGGIVAKNLVGSKEFEKYDVQMVLTEGSPDPWYKVRDPNTTYLDLIDRSDYTPSTDGKIIPANEKNIEILFDRQPVDPKWYNPEYQDDSSILGPTHNLDDYVRSLTNLDRTEHREIANLEEDSVKIIPPGSKGKMYFFKLRQPKG